MATKTLYVGNLPYGVTEDEVKELFTQWGPPGEVRLIADKGFAFVDLDDDKAAEAISAVNGQDFKGRALRVDEARPRRDRGEGGGGGFRGGERRGPRW